MSRGLDLDRPVPPVSRCGFEDGEWVHTAEAIILPWIGPVEDVIRNHRIIHSNCHKVEGKLILDRMGYPFAIETTKQRKAHPLKRHEAKHDGEPVIALLGRGAEEILARGSAPAARQLQLGATEHEENTNGNS